jgi:hypothetical protein
LAGRKSARIGRLQRKDTGAEADIYLTPDTSASGAWNYTLRGKDEKGKDWSSRIRTQVRTDQTLAQAIEWLDKEYLNMDEPGTYEVTLDPQAGRAKPVVAEPDAMPGRWRAEFASYQKKRHLLPNQEYRMVQLQACINADPKKFPVGAGVGWKAVRGQINRGYRVIEVDVPNKLARIRSIAETGITETGGSGVVGSTQVVPMGDLIRDRKYDREVRGE